MSEPEKVQYVIPKAYTSLDNWILFITNHRVIATRFDAWGTAFGGIVGAVMDEKKRNKMAEADPNEILATQKNSYAMNYPDMSSVICKKGLTGCSLSFNLENGETKKFGMAKKDYLGAVDILKPYVGDKFS